jgi:hypothetical protein
MATSVEELSGEGRHPYGPGVNELTQERYVSAAQEVLAQLSDDQRRDLVHTLRTQAREQDVNYPGLYEVGSLDDPQTLGGLFGHMRLNSPGLLEQLLSDTPFYDTVFGGIAEAARTS